jgi:hypothetical protein
MMVEGLCRAGFLGFGHVVSAVLRPMRLDSKESVSVKPDKEVFGVVAPAVAVAEAAQRARRGEASRLWPVL